MNIFKYIYIYNLWGFGSGSGSLSQNNKQYIDFLNQFIHSHIDIHRIIDLGCGDWQLHRHIDFKENNNGFLLNLSHIDDIHIDFFYD